MELSDIPAGEETGLIKEERRRFKLHCTSGNLRTLVGYAGFLSAMVLSTTASACAQALGGYVPGNQRNFWRYVGQFMCVVPIVAVKKLDIRVTSKRHLSFLTIVCLIYPAHLWFYYGADAYIPTSSVGCLHITAFIVGSTVVSVFVFREFEWFMSAAVVLCIVGVTLVTQPQFIFPGRELPNIHPLCGLNDQAENLTLHLNSGNDYNSTLDIAWQNTTFKPSNGVVTGKIANVKVGYVYGTLAGLLYFAFICCINKGLNEINSLVITFWTSVTGMILSLVGMAIFERPMLPSTSLCLSLLMTHGITSGSSVVPIVWATSLLSQEECAIVSSFEVVLMCIAQHTVLKDINKGHGNVTEVIGVVAVLWGNMVCPLFHIIAQFGKKR